MSVLIIVIFILSVFNITVVSEDGDNNSTKNNFNISLNFNFGTPTYSTFNINNEEYFKIQLDDLPVSEKLGEPKLPVKPLRILLPYSTDVEKISVTTSEEKIIQDIVFSDIELGGMSRSFGSSLYDNEITPQYEKDYIYPKQLYNNLGIQCLNGYLILFINLYPVRYLGQTNTIYYYDNISLSIQTTEYTYKNILQKFDDKEKILDMVENPQMISSYPDEDFSDNQGSSNYEYVIITTEDLKNASGNYTFYDLIDKRINDGLTCTIKTVENIYQEYEGRDEKEKIRNFIKDAYINWDTKWVLIGGDVEKVPIRYLYDIDGVEEDEERITSDLYYQCLDGDYNYDGDGNWGEEFDGVNGKRIDLLAEVYIGRAPVDDGADISAFVEKTLSYENSDWYEDSYLRNVLSAGENLWTGTGGDGSGYVERCIDYCTDYNQNTYGIPSNRFTITKLYESYESWTDEDAINIINNGVSIINHVGHGTVVAAMKFTVSELDELSNTDKYCLFYSQACHSGQLEKVDECFAERWVNIPKKGGFAAIMDTGYGYGSTNNYDGADNRYAREFFDAIFSPDEKISRIGEANQDSKEDNIWHIDERNMYHVYYNKILLGDPYVSLKGAEEANARFTFDPLYPKTNEIIYFYDRSLGMITYRSWSFGDGQTSSTKNPTHVYGSEYIYQVTLTVQDNQGYSSTITKSVDVRNQWVPIAKILPSSYNGVNFKIDFSAAESWDPDGTITLYEWDFDDGATSNLIEPVHIYDEEGIYHVSLTVEDNDGNVGREFATIVLSMQYPPNIPVFIDGTNASFTGDKSNFIVVSNDPENNLIQYGWDFGDGSEVKWSKWYSSGEYCTFYYEYPKAGSFKVKVKARDENYAESNWSEEYTILVTDEKEPFLEVIKPLKGIYVSNEKRRSFLTTMIFGKIDVIVNATDASGIEKVLFYIDNQNNPTAEALSPPYMFVWQEKMFFKHTIRIVAIDNTGRETSLEIKVWKFF